MPKHREQLKPWADKWIANAMRARPMDESDRKAMRLAVQGLYEAAGLTPPPRIVFVPSPFVLRFAGGFAAAIWHDRTQNATRAATYAATHAATAAATDAATDDATYAATHAATYAATHAATAAATDDATYDATHAAWRAASAAATYDRYHVRDLPEIIAWVRNTVGTRAMFWWKCAAQSWRMWDGGNQWSAWAGYLSFFRHIAKLPLDYSKWQYFELAATHGGPRIMHPQFCMISDFPITLQVDAHNRPHAENGPFCRWRDGSCIYAWHGVYVPAWIVERPQDITIVAIESEQNAEVKRVMIERYGHERYIRDAKLERAQVDDYGELYARGDYVVVRVVDVARNSDGSEKVHFLPVHPELRPLLADGELGEPQAMTARNAVASTFGLRGKQYEPAWEA